MSKNKIIRFDNSYRGKYFNEYIKLFEDFIRNEDGCKYSADGMFAALMCVNKKLYENLQENNNEIDDFMAYAIIDAAEHITDKMFVSKECKEKIAKQWDVLPLLLSLADSIEMEMFKADINEDIENFTEEQRNLFNVVLDEVWNTEGQRRILIDGEGIRVPAVIESEEEREFLYYHVQSIIISFVYGRCDLNVLLFAKETPDGDIISALRNDDGDISILGADVLEWSYTHNPLTMEYIGEIDATFENFNLKFD